MIIEIEDRFCKVAKVFSKVLDKVQRAAERVDAPQKKQDDDVPRGKRLKKGEKNGRKLRLARQRSTAARSARVPEGRGDHGRRNEASRLARSEDQPGET